MIIPALLSALLRLFGPEVDEVNASVAAELEVRAECEGPLWERPFDCPERVRWALVAISDRECPGDYCAHRTWVGRHGGDSGHDKGLWAKGHRRGARGYREGALHWWCPAHQDPVGMSTVGPHGLIYLYNVHRLGVLGNCVPGWILAAPSVSARAALDRYLELCGAESPSGWCPTIKAAFNSRIRRCHRRELPRDECKERNG